MKKLLILLFSLLISFNSYGEWTLSDEWDNGDTQYIDLDTIKSVDGYVFWWGVKNSDYDDGYKSLMAYVQGDCKMTRVKSLSFNLHKERMGKGESIHWASDDWHYPRPDSHMYYELNFVCDYVD
jgi:hypothetical protein